MLNLANGDMDSSCSTYRSNKSLNFKFKSGSFSGANCKPLRICMCAPKISQRNSVGSKATSAAGAIVAVDDIAAALVDGASALTSVVKVTFALMYSSSVCS